MLMGSADLMPRNLDGRVEILFPLQDPRMRQIVRDSILFKHLKDTRHLRRMAADGVYHPVQPPQGEPELDSQAWMLEHRGVWNTEEGVPLPAFIQKIRPSFPLQSIVASSVQSFLLQRQNCHGF